MTRTAPGAADGGRFGGVILAGGRSRRMGRPKAWLPLGERTMLETVADAVRQGLRAAGGEIHASAPPLVVVAAPGQELPALDPGVQRVEDEIEGEGPLRGMAAGLAALQGRAGAAFVSSCDVPLLRPGFVRRMLELLDGHDVVVPRHADRHHPLAAVYRIGVLAVVRDLLASGLKRPFSLFERVKTRVVEASDFADVDPQLESLANFNTPDEYAALLRRLDGAPRAAGQAIGVTFELYGVARLRAGRQSIAVRGDTIGSAIAALERACPVLAGPVLEAGRLNRHFRLSLNGRSFVSDPDHPLSEGDTLILMSAEAGG